MTKITAHRGYSAKYPENTMISFEKAVKVGAERIELDIYATTDKKLVIHHDYALGRTNNGEGFIFEKTWEYLKHLDAGSWLGKEFSGERIVVLEDVFKTFHSKIEYEIEFKGFGKEFIQQGVALVRENNLQDCVEFTSFSAFTLSYLRKMLPNVKLGMFIPPLAPWQSLELAQKISFAEMQLGEISVGHFPLELLTTEFVKYLHSNRFLVHAANCQTETDIMTALSYGVDQLATDDPELAIKVRDEFMKRC